jgi:hypothetical protein
MRCTSHAVIYVHLQLFGLDHTFSWRLWIAILEIERGERIKERDANSIWYSDRGVRLRAMEIVDEIFRRICIKWYPLRDIDEKRRKALEHKLAYRLRRGNPT